ncbi:MAG: hypothetical protein DPW14_17375, partial [Planctomycetes bacterium]|nr:hypothetical protein [Planctomycetota bacterium]
MLCLVLGFWSAACLAQDKSVQFTATINLAVLDTSGTGVQDVEITVEPDDLWGMSMALYEFEIPDLPDCTLSLTGAGTTDAQGKATIEVTAKVSGRVLPNWGSQPWFSCWVKVLKKDVAPRFVRIMAHSGQTYVLKVQGFGAGGTDNHMVMVDITGTGKNGKEIEDLVGAQGVY